MVGTYYTTQVTSSTSRTTTSTGARPIPAGSRATPTSSTARSMVGGTTVLVPRRTPDYPDPGSFWNMIEELRGHIFYTAPTAIRMFMKMGEQWPDQYDLSARSASSARSGSRSTPRRSSGIYRVIGKERLPDRRHLVADRDRHAHDHDHDRRAHAPGLCRKADPRCCGRRGEQERRVRAARDGRLPRRSASPGRRCCARSTANDAAVPASTGPRSVPGCYLAGDLAIKDKDGYIMVIGRADDLIIVSGHNIGTAEVESALVSHHAVAEAAVIGKPDSVKGNQIKAFVILRVGHEPSERLKNDLLYQVRMHARADRDAVRDRVRGRAAQDPVGQDHAPGPQGPRARDRPRRPLDPGGVGDGGSVPGPLRHAPRAGALGLRPARARDEPRDRLHLRLVGLPEAAREVLRGRGDRVPPAVHHLPRVLCVHHAARRRAARPVRAAPAQRRRGRDRRGRVAARVAVDLDDHARRELRRRRRHRCRHRVQLSDLGRGALVPGPARACCRRDRVRVRPLGAPDGPARERADRLGRAASGHGVCRDCRARRDRALRPSAPVPDGR